MLIMSVIYNRIYITQINYYFVGFFRLVSHLNLTNFRKCLREFAISDNNKKLKLECVHSYIKLLFLYYIYIIFVTKINNDYKVRRLTAV